MKTEKEILENLCFFTGSEHMYLHPFGIKFSDGVKYLAESAEMWWYVDLVASYQHEPKVKSESFQVFKLIVDEDKTAIVEISDGNNNILMKQKIEFTDTPLKEVVLWCIDKICILPTEY